jgi:nicotinamidase/pyrazinamidase
MPFRSSGIRGQEGAAMISLDPVQQLRLGDALLIVDVQPDFCPGGALPVPDGDAVVPELNRWIDAAHGRAVPIYASRDWHPPQHPSFQSQGGEWPPHCIQDTPGAAYHPALQLPANAIKIAKGTRLDRDQYSAFDETGLVSHLREHRIARLWIGGLAEDVCVRASALDARRAGFEVHLIPSATRPLSAERGAAARAALQEAGIMVHEVA